jgi:hypothetical protein
MIDKDAPTIVLVEKIRFEEIGKLGKVKMSMDFSKGGRFNVVDEKKAKEAKPIEGKLNKKQDEDEVFNGKDEMSDLPF